MLGLHLSSTGPHTLHEQRSLPQYVGFIPCRSPALAAFPRKAGDRFSASQLQSPVRQLDWTLAAVGAGSFRAADRWNLRLFARCQAPALGAIFKLSRGNPCAHMHGGKALFMCLAWPGLGQELCDQAS